MQDNKGNITILVTKSCLYGLATVKIKMECRITRAAARRTAEPAICLAEEEQSGLPDTLLSTPSGSVAVSNKPSRHVLPSSDYRSGNPLDLARFEVPQSFLTHSSYYMTV